MRTDVWVITLPASKTLVQTGLQWLDPDEHARLRRMPSESNRDRFVACRTVLRYCLAPHLNCSEANVRFTYGASGKPEIPGCSRSFNISHSGDYGLVAISLAPAVGVDIEHVNARRNLAALTRHVFHPNEIVAFDRVEPKLRGKFFYDLWVRKEAVTKWLGDSIFRVKDINVLDTMSSPRVITVNGRGSAWVMPVKVSSQYASAVAIDTFIDSPCPTVTIHEWNG